MEASVSATADNPKNGGTLECPHPKAALAALPDGLEDAHKARIFQQCLVQKLECRAVDFQVSDRGFRIHGLGFRVQDRCQA